MNYKKEYKTETNRSPYVYSQKGEITSSFSYTDAYVSWLENKLKLLGVPDTLQKRELCIVCNLPTDGEKCYSKRCPV